MRRLASALLLSAIATFARAESTPPSPSEFLRLQVGADRTLADYRQIVSYFRALDAASPRLEMETLGSTTLGEPMVMAVISSEENIAKLDRIREISRRLADPRGLTAGDIDAFVREGKAVVLVTCNIHSTEIASSQMAMEWAWSLSTANDPATRERLDNVVLLLVPSLNPDGQIMITDWYRKQLGTRYEGGPMPWLYHPYVGHDNNRDWFMLTQKETRNMSRAIYHEWFPQVFVDLHQMGREGPRMFIPPFADPLDPDVHPLIWREVNLIGSTMAFRLEQNEKPGAIYGYSFDAYWLGGTRNTGWWKNITGLLLETASVKVATPVYIEPTELEGGGKGLIDYKPQVNHPNPWRGGWWRLRDIMDYERIASDALLETVASHREDFLRDIVRRAQSAIADGGSGAYVIPAAQRDYPTARLLAQLLADHGVEVIITPGGDYWIPMAQPYGRFVTEMLEPQRYPEVRLSREGDVLPPYDVATWTLPLMMGVEVRRTNLPAGLQGSRVPEALGGTARLDGASAALPSSPFYSVQASSPEAARVVNSALAGGGSAWADGNAFVIDAKGAAAASTVIAATSLHPQAAASVAADARPLRKVRVGIYRPWTGSTDEGWTRWLLEQYGFDVRSVDNAAVRSAKPALGQRFDAFILPDLSKGEIDGPREKPDETKMNYEPELPPEYRGRIGKEGTAALVKFVEDGGTLIALDSSSDWVIAHFNVPVRNVLAKTEAREFNCPGSLLRAHVAAGHPVTLGLPAEVAIFSDDAIAFETTIPGSEMERRVLAWYPEDPRDILLSGWIRGQEKLVRRAAAVAMTYGKGRIVLFGFHPQNRAQTHATFPFLFNAIWWR